MSLPGSRSCHGGGSPASFRRSLWRCHVAAAYIRHPSWSLLVSASVNGELRQFADTLARARSGDRAADGGVISPGEASRGCPALGSRRLNRLAGCLLRG